MYVFMESLKVDSLLKKNYHPKFIILPTPIMIRIDHKGKILMTPNVQIEWFVSTKKLKIIVFFK